MARGPKQPNKAIQSLLDERRRIEQWLERLSMAADKSPESVRSKVERDYRTRLATVLEELEGHRDELAQTLDRQREHVEELAAKEQEVSEELSEAELRHAVGEYDEGEWTKVRTGILESLVKLREDIKTARGDIDGLEEVLAAVSGAAAAGGDDADEVDEEVPALEELEAEKPKRVSGQTDAFDELAFLKSVTEDDQAGPHPDRAIGVQQGAPGSETPAPRDKSGDRKKKRKGETQVGAAGVSAVESSPEPSKGMVHRSLKCADCGAMNLPTEWYCENCGAELAAV